MALNNQEKKKFIVDALEGMKNDLLAKVDRMPDEWDGIELRWLIVDKTKEQISYDRNAGVRKGKRYKEYQNTVIVENL